MLKKEDLKNGVKLESNGEIYEVELPLRPFYFVRRKGCSPLMMTLENLNEQGFKLHTDNPPLKVNDPVIVGQLNLINYRHFLGWTVDNKIITIANGGSKWTNKNNKSTGWDIYRLPTPEELEERGYPRDYYTSRGL